MKGSWRDDAERRGRIKRIDLQIVGRRIQWSGFPRMGLYGTPNSIDGDLNQKANQKAYSGTEIGNMNSYRRNWLIVMTKLWVWCSEQVYI